MDGFHLKLLFCELQPQVKEVIDIAGMADHFNIFPTELQAFENV
jgi:anti-anti-sigma regulatory factor